MFAYYEATYLSSMDSSPFFVFSKSRYFICKENTIILIVRSLQYEETTKVVKPWLYCTQCCLYSILFQMLVVMTPLLFNASLSVLEGPYLEFLDGVNMFCGVLIVSSFIVFLSTIMHVGFHGVLFSIAWKCI